MNVRSTDRVPIVVRLCLASGVVTAAITTLFWLGEFDYLPIPASLSTWCGISFLLSLCLWIAAIVMRVRVGRLTGMWMAHLGATLGVVMCAAAMLTLPVCAMVYSAATRSRISNELKRIGDAILAYQKAHGHLPSAAIRSADGKPLLSWRVTILPYMGQNDLYERFHLGEPWDSPANLPLLSQMPADFHLATIHNAPKDQTYFQVFIGQKTAFERDGLRTPEDFPDGPSNTFLVAEAATAVPWTQPADLRFDPTGPLPKLGPVVPGSQNRRASFMVVLVDGSVRSFEKTIDPATLRAAITRNGNDKLGRDW